MSSNPAVELASAIQSVSINRAPSPHHDINPSTSASVKEPLEEAHPRRQGPEEPRSHSPTPSLDSDIVAPENQVRPRPRRATLPPLPDFRFEQSYLASIQHADTWWKVFYITTRDQVLLPLVQGTVWTLVLSGWRYWNRSAEVGGRTLGGRIRKWWWEVNNWKLPEAAPRRQDKVAESVKEVSHPRDGVWNWAWGRG